jgi:hypothetical protein
MSTPQLTEEEILALLEQGNMQEFENILQGVLEDALVTNADKLPTTDIPLMQAQMQIHQEILEGETELLEDALEANKAIDEALVVVKDQDDLAQVRTVISQ